MQGPAIVWFRQDLRLADNAALAAASRTGAAILPVYILDDFNAGEWLMGAASRWWLHHSLTSLDHSLQGHLRCFRGTADDILPRLAAEVDASGVFWGRCYEPWRVERDRRIKRCLRERGRIAESFNSSLLFEPQSITKRDGTPYKVFTPFYRNGCLGGAPAPRAPAAAAPIRCFHRAPTGGSIDDLSLLPAVKWYDEIASAWRPGEAGAHARLKGFRSHDINNYGQGRDRPDLTFVSRLSPHLHFGELSPHQAWHAINPDDVNEVDADRFRSELGWREFSYYLLYHQPELPSQNLQKRFDNFAWRDDPAALHQWQRGETGYPIVDAGMRELWRTGYMHNRVRMIAGSFLVKNLLLHWHHGARWFWDTLLDADLASNSAGWQWIAGCGADAAPYFRIFNPVTQGRKHDPAGDYVRRYVPEIAALPDRFLHCPFDAPPETLAAAGVELGTTYPRPIVELPASRRRALAAYSALASGPP